MRNIYNRIGGFFTNAKKIYNATWIEVPWLRAASTMLIWLAAIAYVIPPIFSLFGADITTLPFYKDMNKPPALYYACGLIFVIYFWFVAFFANDRLTVERKLRSIENGFQYDNRGTLYNSREPNIAFRIATFRGFLSGVAGKIGHEDLKEVLRETGRSAANDFAKHLPEIYNLDVAHAQKNKKWDDLTFHEKISKWADYDSATGWGILTGKTKDASVNISVTHLEGLLAGASGELFGNFLAGYCEVVISSIVKGHVDGKFAERSSAELINVDTKSDRTLEMDLILR